MKSLDIIQKLIVAETPFKEEFLSNEELCFALETSKYMLISNIGNHIAYWLIKGMEKSQISLIEKKLEENLKLKEQVLELLNQPKTIKVLFNPISQIARCEEDNGNFVFFLSERTKNNFAALVEEIDFEVQLELKLMPGSLFAYKEEAKPENSFFNKACRNSKGFISAMACGLLLSTNVSAGTVANHVQSKQHKISHAPFTLKKITNLASKVNDSLNESLFELEKSFGEESVLLTKSIQNLSTDEMNQLFSNLNSGYKHKDNSQNREELDIDKVESIVEIIRIFSKNRNKVTEKIAQAIYSQAKKRNIDYHLMTAIIMQESSFNIKAHQKNTNGTHDMSIAQINYETWVDEFDRLNRDELDKEKLKDFNYAIDRMGEILEIVKTRKPCQDKYWFACYHSVDPSNKMEYADLINKKLAFIKKVELEQTKEKINFLLVQIKKTNRENPEYSKVNFEKIDNLFGNLSELDSMIDAEAIKIQVLLASK